MTSTNFAATIGVVDAGFKRIVFPQRWPHGRPAMMANGKFHGLMTIPTRVECSRNGCTRPDGSPLFSLLQFEHLTCIVLKEVNRFCCIRIRLVPRFPCILLRDKPKTRVCVYE